MGMGATMTPPVQAGNSARVTREELRQIAVSVERMQANNAVASSNLGSGSTDRLGASVGGGKPLGFGGAANNILPTGGLISASSGPMNTDVERLAQAAHSKFAGNPQSRCFDVANSFSQSAGGSNLSGTKGDTSMRGRDISELSKLPAGSVAYMSLNPGSDPNSTNLANQPHWVISVGDGKFTDNWKVNMTTEEMVAKYGNRKIDETFKPPAKFEGASTSVA
jgi:hypothetical protein